MSYFRILLVFFSFSLLVACGNGGKDSISEIKEYDVDIKQHENGKLIATVDGLPFTGGKIKKGSSLLLIAKPAPCFRVSSWEGVIPEKENFRKASLTVDESKTIAVNFEKISTLKTVVEIDSPVTVGYGDISEGKWKIHHRGREIEEDFVVAPYAIGITEVSYKLWKEVLDWAEKKDYIFANKGQKGGTKYNTGYDPNNHNEEEPVTMISYRDAIVWCNAYTEKEFGSAECIYCKVGGIPLRNSEKPVEILIDLEHTRGRIGFRLPTNPEWEFAARGGDPKASDWKYKFSGSDNIAKVAWYEGNSDLRTHRVNEGIPNRLGLYNMTGNMHEYVGDKYSHTTDKVLAILRGGSFRSGIDHCLVENRMKFGDFDHRQPEYGFRIACSFAE